MPELPRRAVLTTIGVLTTAGCITGPGTGNSTEEPPTDQPQTKTSSPTDRTTTGNWITQAANKPDADHTISLSNESTRKRTIQVQVVQQATGELVFDETRTVSPGVEQDIYNLKQADPDDIEAFSICGQLVEPPRTPTTIETPKPNSERTGTPETPDSPYRDCITMRTNACFGNAHITVQDSGELQVIYSIC